MPRILNFAILSTLLLLANCSPSGDGATSAAQSSSSETATYTGRTFQFSESEVIARASEVAPDLKNVPAKPFNHASGLSCTSREWHGGDLSICSAGNNVATMRFKAYGNGSDAAKAQFKTPTEVFMSALQLEPYTAKDKARILTAVEHYLNAPGDNQTSPNWVAIGLYAIQVIPGGHSYSLELDAGNQPGN